MKRIFTAFLLLVGFFLSGTNASAQWNLAAGFSNPNGFSNFDDVTGFIIWGNSLLANANCSLDLIQNPNGTPDSLFLSGDNGQTWTSASGGVMPLFISGTGPTATFFANISGVLSYSNDGEQTWTQDSLGLAVQGLGGGTAGSMVAFGNKIIMSSAYGVYSQTSQGTVWAADTAGLGLGNTISLGQVGNLIQSGNNLFLSTGWSGIFLSTNQGSSWSQVNNGLATVISGGILQWLPAEQFAVSGSSVFAMTSHDISGIAADLYSSDFYRTTNNGTSWTKMNSTPENNWGSTYGIAASGSSVFAVTDSGFYVSTDNAATWAQANQGMNLNGDHTYCIQITNGNIVIGTGASGAWYRKVSDFGSSSVSSSNSAASSSLSQSYPNPVITSSKINYSLATGGSATLSVFDVTGKQVATLSNGYQIAGDHTVTFNGSTLPAGIYFYRLTSAEGSTGHWLQLIK